MSSKQKSVPSRGVRAKIAAELRAKQGAGATRPPARSSGKQAAGIVRDRRNCTTASIVRLAKVALAEAEKLRDAGLNRLQVFNALYGVGGKLGELFPTEPERRGFMTTDEYRRINEILDGLPSEAREPRAIADKVTSASGTTIVRMPKSLHEALVREAEAEGVSLNQLCVGKLAVQLRQVVGG